MSDQKITILVIDDNEDQLSWFRLFNTPTCPYNFYTLQNEVNAAQALKKINPAVIFLDISLNTLDGPIVATILNGNDFDDSRIISMSASSKNKGSINTANFLQKPLTKDMVFNKIKEVLGH